MTTFDPALCARLVSEVREHLDKALWPPLANIAIYNVGPATHAAVEWLASPRGLKRLADQLEAALAEVERMRSELIDWKSPCVDVGSTPSGWVCPTCKDPKCGDV